MKKIEQKTISAQQFTTLLLGLEQDAKKNLETITTVEELTSFEITYFGKKGEFTRLAQEITHVASQERKTVGVVINSVKNSLLQAFHMQKIKLTTHTSENEWIDVTLPGKKPPQGHLHIVTQAISEIESIFARIGFWRVRHPEVDRDWYAFEALNMPPTHPARDEWETFFIKDSNVKNQMSKIVLTPHTSNGQVREMERIQKLIAAGDIDPETPIRMINIARCYRRQSDISHVPMFHQFEGLYVDKNVSIPHLKGILDYFAKSFFESDRKMRIRPFHFQFTEPSFEIDISCDLCHGHGCRMCKEGWLELGGAGMVHPVVLKNGGYDPEIYSGFAFGWGVERTYMMKRGLKIDDVRLPYSNDLRFLQQF